MIRLDLFSDPVCPWCFIGASSLLRALESTGAQPFTLEWHPYELNPEIGPEGEDRRAYLRAKFGDRLAAAEAQVEAAAEAAGLVLDQAGVQRQPNTRNAHRLIHWAGLEGRQTPLALALMRAHWQEGRDIGAGETLIEMATAQGMDGALIRRLLASEADLDLIAAREAHAQERGIRAVPCFILADHYVIEGAQPADFWQKVIAEVQTAR